MVKLFSTENANTIICGTKTCPSGNAEPITASSTPIYQGVRVRARSLATGGTYIGIGNASAQPYRLDLSANLLIDFADNLNAVYVKCDVSSNAVLEYIGL